MAAPLPSPLYDPHSPALQADLYRVYRALRDDDPVHYCAPRKLFAVSRYEDVVAVLRDTERFASGGVAEANLLLPMIVFMDGEKHRSMRAVLTGVFTPRRVAALEPRIRAAVTRLLDRMEKDGERDFLHGFAAALPSIVICELIGIPEERRQGFLECTDAMIESGPDGHPIEEPAGRIYAEFATLLDERRDDLMSALLDATVEGEPLSREELLGFCFNLVVGGTDTTMNLIGNGAVLLARHPEQRSLLASDPDRIPDAVEEMLRFESPTQALPRRVVADTELQDVALPAGARLTVLFGSANHDERTFPDAERFDVTRGRMRHLAFGLGNHHCLGAALARLEARVVFEELLGRYPEYRLLAEPGWVTSRWARSHPSIPMALTP